jgi:hypothetical protein
VAIFQKNEHSLVAIEQIIIIRSALAVALAIGWERWSGAILHSANYSERKNQKKQLLTLFLAL